MRWHRKLKKVCALTASWGVKPFVCELARLCGSHLRGCQRPRPPAARQRARITIRRWCTTGPFTHIWWDKITTPDKLNTRRTSDVKSVSHLEQDIDSEK